MTNQQVPKKNTPVSEAQLSRAMLDVAKELFGIQLTKPQLALLVAQNNLETGNRKYMWNWNIGNITHANDKFDYFMGGDKTKNKNGEWVPTTLKFRSYESLNEGVKDYLGNLKQRGSGIVWNAIMKGDPATFSKALKTTKYYEADEADYTKGITSQVSAYNKRDSYESAISNTTPAATTSAPITNTGFLGQVEALIEKFLKAIAEAQQTDLKK